METMAADDIAVKQNTSLAAMLMPRATKATATTTTILQASSESEAGTQSEAGKNALKNIGKPRVSR